MTHTITGKEIIFTHNLSTDDIILRPSEGKNLYFQGTLASNAGLIISNATFTNLLATNSTIGSMSINNISANAITSINISGTNISGTNISGTNSSFTNLLATNSTIGSLVANSGLFGSLRSSNLNASSGLFDSLTSSNLNVTSGTIGSLNAGSGLFGSSSVSNLNATRATIGSLNASTGLFGTLTSSSLNASTGLFGSMTSTNLNATSATITSLNAGSGLFGSLTSSNLYATNATIGSLIANSGLFGTLTSTNLFVSSGLFNSLSGTNLNVTSSSISSLNASNATVSSLTVTSGLFSASTTTNLNATNATISNLNVSNIKGSGTMTISALNINAPSGSVIFATAAGLLTSSSLLTYNNNVLGATTAQLSTIQGSKFIINESYINNKGSAGLVNIDATQTGLATLTAAGTSTTSKQGYSVSIYNDTVVAMNPYDIIGVTNGSGSVAVYRYSSSWTLEQLIKPNYAVCSATCVWGAVKLYANTLAFAKITVSSDTASLDVWTRSGSTWTQQKQIDDNIQSEIDLCLDLLCGITSPGELCVYTRSSTVWTRSYISGAIGMTKCACNRTLVAYCLPSTYGKIVVINTSGTTQGTIYGNVNNNIGAAISMSELGNLLATSNGTNLSIFDCTTYQPLFTKNVPGVTTFCTFNKTSTGYPSLLMYGDTSRQYFIGITWSGSVPTFSPQSTSTGTSPPTTLSYGAVAINSTSCYANQIAIGYPATSSNAGQTVVFPWSLSTVNSLTDASLSVSSSGMVMNSDLPIVISSTIPAVNSSFASLTAPSIAGSNIISDVLTVTNVFHMGQSTGGNPGIYFYSADTKNGYDAAKASGKIQCWGGTAGVGTSGNIEVDATVLIANVSQLQTYGHILSNAVSTLDIGNSTNRFRDIYSNTLNASSAAASSNTTTGAIVTAGGLGVAGNASIGGNINLTGALTANNQLICNKVGQYGNNNNSYIDMASVNITRFYNNGLPQMRIGFASGALTAQISVGGTCSPTVTDANGTTMAIKGPFPQTPLTIISDTTSAHYAITFNNANGGVGNITTSGSNTSFNTSSDYRLKKNIRPMTDSLEKILKLRPCYYNWKADGSQGEGFVAHELQEVIPMAVCGQKDKVDKNGQVVSQGIDTSFLMGTVVAAIQELVGIKDIHTKKMNDVYALLIKQADLIEQQSKLIADLQTRLDTIEAIEAQIINIRTNKA